MAAMSAASGAFAHDFNWNFASLKAIEDATKVQEELNKLPYGNPNYTKVQADGNVKITKNGLAFVGGSQAANNVSFAVQADDEITITATGNTTNGKFYVALDGVVTTAEMKDGVKLKVNVGTATNIAVWSTEDVMISSIEVQSKAYRNVKADIENTLEIMNRRIEDINGYAAEVPDFYLKVKAQINKQGKKIEEISAKLLEFAANNEVANNNGEDTLKGLLSDVRAFIGTKGTNATTDAEKGSIYLDAKAAYDTYSKIVTTDENKMDAEVKTANDVIKGCKAKTDADWDKYTSSNRFYNRKKNDTTGKYTYTEKWTAANTASKTAALSLFEEYVVKRNKELVDSAAIVLAKYPETADLNKHAAKFNEVGQRAKNIWNRYAYEEQKVNNKKNYVAVQELQESVAKMVEFSAANTTLFDQTGLADLAKNTTELFTELKDRTNTHSIKGPKEYFGGKFNTFSATANEMKLKWGNAANGALVTEYTEVQKKLDACSEAIATKFQNDQETLKKYELKFAAQQAEITKIKNACSDMGTDPEKAYNLAKDYAGYMETLSKVKTELGSLWSDTQTAENKAIIEANNKTLAELKEARDAARAQYNKAVAQLDSYRKGKFFDNEYIWNGTEYATLRTSIEKSIKTLYDYSVLIEDAYTNAEKKVAECNKEGKPGEIVAEKANLTEFETAISDNADLIKAALNATVAEANDVVKTFFDARDSENRYKTIEQATDEIKAYDTNIYAYKSVAKIKAENPDFASEAAFADASKEIGIAVTGTNDKEGKLIITTEDIASASAKIKEFYNANPQTLADDVVKEDDGVVVTTINGAIAKAALTVEKLQSYVDLRKRMFSSSVEWSVAQSKAAGAEEAIKADLIKYLGTLNEEMKAAEKKLKEEDKLNADVEKYNKMLDDFDARIANAKDPAAFKKYLATEAAKTEINTKLGEAQGRIDEAKAELAKLSKENAKTYLSGEITKAENALVAVKADFEGSTDLLADKEQILKDIANIDLKVAIAAAKKLDTVVEGDFNEDGKVDDADLDIASKKYDAEEMTQSEYSVFLETYKKSFNK